MGKKTLAILVSIFLLITITPIGIAWLLPASDAIWGGLFFNPLDGNSYIAKMYQGFVGAWKFVLPFTASQGEGGYLFTFYLFLGHLARWLGISLISAFHISRVLASTAMLLAIYKLTSITFVNHKGAQRLSFFIAAFGSGMGWLFLAAGKFGADFWVAEAYPFLSAYANPHFSLGMAIMLYLIFNIQKPFAISSLIIFLLGGFLLAITVPFACVLVLILLCYSVLFENKDTTEKGSLFRLFMFLIGVAPILLYQLWVVNTNPTLSWWNAQNVTLTPAWWDLIISFSPSIFIAIYGLIVVIRRGGNHSIRMMAVWLVTGSVLVFLPFSLQRRFLFGIFIPITLLAVHGMNELFPLLGRARKWLSPLMISLLIPTNLIILLMGVNAIITKEPLLFLSTSEEDTIIWIRENTKSDALVLASPEIGSYLPARTGRRVIYGHPFETVNAEEEKKSVLGFFNGNMDVAHQREFLATRKVNYIFWGHREKAIGNPFVLSELIPVHITGDVTIFAVQNSP